MPKKSTSVKTEKKVTVKPPVEAEKQVKSILIDFDKEKMEKAMSILKNIEDLGSEYAKLTDDFTDEERAFVGGLIFTVYAPAAALGQTLVIGNPVLIKGMLKDLNEVVERRKSHLSMFGL